MELSRRHFIGSLAALAALSATKDAAALLPRTDQERLLAQMADGGVIRNQTFRLTGPVVFENITVTFINCQFYFVGPIDDHAITFKDKSKVHMVNCSVIGNAGISGCLLYFAGDSSHFDGGSFNGIYVERNLNNHAGWKIA